MPRKMIRIPGESDGDYAARVKRAAYARARRGAEKRKRADLETRANSAHACTRCTRLDALESETAALRAQCARLAQRVADLEARASDPIGDTSVPPSAVLFAFAQDGGACDPYRCQCHKWCFINGRNDQIGCVACIRASEYGVPSPHQTTV